MYVRHCLVGKEVGEDRKQIIPTLRAMALNAKVTGRRHVALGKLVFVIPEKRFARITAVDEKGTLFTVDGEQGRETQVRGREGYPRLNGVEWGDLDKRMRPLRWGWKHWVEGLLLLTAAWKEAEHYTIGKASGVLYLRTL